MATRYSGSSTEVKPNALASSGISQTAVVSTRLAIAAPFSSALVDFSEISEPRCERMLKLWKISAMLIVRNAIVMPSALSVISQSPDSMKCPMK